MGMLDQRVALVTGASAGIGRSIARAVVEQGGRVVVNARRVERLEELCAELGDAAAACPGDAGDPAVIDRALALCEQRFGSPADLVVINAGRGLKGGVLDSDTAQWEEMVKTNIVGAAHLLRVSASAMAARFDEAAWPGPARDIVVLGSTVGRHISPFSSMYGSTKFAVHAITEAVRREVGPKGVRVSLIEPGIVRTEFQAVAGYDPDGFGDFMKKIGPVLEPEDIARLVVFIAAQPAHVHIGDAVIRGTRQDYP